MSVSLLPDVLLLGDPMLRQTASAVKPTAFGRRLQRTADTMFRVMQREEGIGLAAVQIGIDLRMFVSCLEGAPPVVINPHITYGGENLYHQEGCLSLPGVQCDVPRHSLVVLEGFEQFVF